MVDGHSFKLIRQMAALVRRALVEVCTVPVLLVQDSLSRFGWLPYWMLALSHIADAGSQVWVVMVVVRPMSSI